MKLISIILLSLILTACGGSGGGGDSSNSPAPFEYVVAKPEPCVPVSIPYDYYGQSGIIIEKSEDSCLSTTDIELLYVEVLACVGVAVPTTAARVSFISYTETGRNPTVLGQYQPLSQDVWINKEKINTIKLSRYALSHEFVHHALYLSGFDPDANHNHESPTFTTCVKYPN